MEKIWAKDVKEGEKVTGIVTKIDLIEFLGDRMK